MVYLSWIRIGQNLLIVIISQFEQIYVITNKIVYIFYDYVLKNTYTSKVILIVCLGESFDSSVARLESDRSTLAV